jgi:hypothetical protein
MFLDVLKFQLADWSGVEPNPLQLEFHFGLTEEGDFIFDGLTYSTEQLNLGYSDLPGRMRNRSRLSTMQGFDRQLAKIYDKPYLCPMFGGPLLDDDGQEAKDNCVIDDVMKTKKADFFWLLNSTTIRMRPFKALSISEKMLKVFTENSEKIEATLLRSQQIRISEISIGHIMRPFHFLRHQVVGHRVC